MTVGQSAAIGTWFRDEADEEGMHEDHAYLWRHLIDVIPEKDFSRSTVLDYGCNRGGFLNLLHRTRPFKNAIGIDVAQTSLALARQRSADLPVEYVLPEEMVRFAASVDVGFSHEVLYLLPDLDAHAASIARTLKSGGVYYAAIGCHTGNPLWSYWREIIEATSNLPSFDYSLDDYARAFWKAGLSVSMRPFQLQDFVFIKSENSYFPSAADSLAYHTEIKTIIRAAKAG